MKNKFLIGFFAIFAVLSLMNLPVYADELNGDDKIFLLPSRDSAQSHDFILVQSNGKFGLIDVGTNRNSESYNQQDIYDFIDKIGVKTLDFILITHFDEDHITALSKSLGDETQTIFDRYDVKAVIFKPLLDYSYISSSLHYIRDTDYYARMKQAYDEIVNVLHTKNISYGLKKAFTMGDFSFNIVNDYELSSGERANFWMNLESLGVLVEKSDYKMFLGGDIENADLDQTISDLRNLGVTSLDAFKMNHHGYSVSSTDDRTILPVRGNFGFPIIGITNSRETLSKSSSDAPTKIAIIESASPNGIYWQNTGIVKFDFSNLSEDGLTVSQMGNILESSVKHIDGVQRFSKRTISSPTRDDFIIDRMIAKKVYTEKADISSHDNVMQVQIKAPSTGLNDESKPIIFAIAICFLVCILALLRTRKISIKIGK